jgi:hypothetical protein
MGITQQIGASSLNKAGVCTLTTRPASPYEGQMIYETDTDMVAIWNGTAWRYIASTTPTNGTVLQVVRSTLTSDRNTTSTSYTDVTDASVTITPKSTSSSIIVIASFLGIVVNSASGHNLGSYQITDSANTGLSGATNQSIGALNYTNVNGYFYAPVTMMGFVSPNSISAQTYKLRFQSFSAATTTYVAGATTTTQLFAIELAG